MRLRTFWFCLTWLLLIVGVNAADVPKAETKPASGKSYQIRNKKYGNLLRPEEANSADGTRIVLYPAQPWKCMTWKLESAGEDRFHLRNHFISKTFAAENAGAKSSAVTQVSFAKNPEGRPNWVFTRLADSAYKITEAKSGLALTAVSDRSSSSQRITVQTWQGTEDQEWELIEIDPKQLTM